MRVKYPEECTFQLPNSLKSKLLTTMVRPPGYAGFIRNLPFWAIRRLEHMLKWVFHLSHYETCVTHLPLFPEMAFDGITVESWRKYVMIVFIQQVIIQISNTSNLCQKSMRGLLGQCKWWTFWSCFNRVHHKKKELWLAISLNCCIGKLV